VGNCCVEYYGRANSKLGPGERIIIIKEDGSLLVHRSKGYEPINWMPGTSITYNVRVLKKEEVKWFKNSGGWQLENSIFHVPHEGDVLEIRAVRHKPSESVRVFFDEIYMVSALSLMDSGEFCLYASEEDMQKAILSEPTLLEEGFKPVSYEKKVEPGFVDVYGVDKYGKLVVVEIKRKTAGREAALQLAKYIDAIKSRANREVRGVLAAPELARDAQRLLATLGLEFKHLDPKKCAEVLQRLETRKLEEFFKGS
jgi:RecB family endonuclease NucS